MIDLPAEGRFVGRVWRAGLGPALVEVRDGMLVDVTTRLAPTMRDLLELDDIAGHLDGIDGEALGGVVEIATAGKGAGADATRLLAPVDLQAVKACGVTFARSMIERVIEERAAGDPGRAEAIRARIAGAIGASLADLVPGSEKAGEVKRLLIEEGLWSQYLEVGIGPDAEVFSKAPPMAAVGHGADVGIHPVSRWNNPEPEVVLAVDSKARIRAATLGNDVNLRDVEGRSALLLGKAKDNNASAALGPFLRLFDAGFALDGVRQAELTLTVDGPEGYRLEGHSSMTEISRDPADLVAQTIGAHHQYPDGFVLYLGTMFAPTEDREAPGEGFTHRVGDVVTVHTPALGALVNTVRLAGDCPPWRFGTAALMRNLAGRDLL